MSGVSGVNWQTAPTAKVFSFSAAVENRERKDLAAAERLAGGRLNGTAYDSDVREFWLDLVRKGR